MAQAIMKPRPLVWGCASTAFLLAVAAHAQVAPAQRSPHIRVGTALIEVAAHTIAACGRQGAITLDLEAKWVDEPRWHDFGSAFNNAEGKTIKPVMLQPLFTSTSVSTSLAMKVGAPQLVQVGVGGRGQVLHLILTCDLLPFGGEAAVAAAAPPAP